MPPHHHHHHHRGRGPGFGPPIGGLLVGAAVGAGVAAAFRPPPPAPYYRGRRYHQVVIVRQAPQGITVGAHEQLILVSCPIGAHAGDPLEIDVDGRGYKIVIPQGIAQGQSFYVRVPKPQQQVVVTAPNQQQIPMAPTNNVVYQATKAPVSNASTNNTAASSTSMPTAAVVPKSEAPEAQACVVGILDDSSLSTNTPASISEANPFADDDHDDWVITPNKAEFDIIFAASNPTMFQGKLILSPQQVKEVLLTTGLQKDVLRGVWELSDIDKDGKLDQDEFAVAMYLCRWYLAGNPTLAALPDNVVPPSKRNPF